MLGTFLIPFIEKDALEKRANELVFCFFALRPSLFAPTVAVGFARKLVVTGAAIAIPAAKLKQLPFHLVLQ